MTDDFHPWGICQAGDTQNTCTLQQVYFYYPASYYKYDVMIISALALHFVVKRIIKLWR